MRRFVVLLAIAGLLVGISGSAAPAAPTDVKMIIGPKARLAISGAVEVEVTYVCPASFVTAAIFVTVSQSQTGAVGQSLNQRAPCTDQRETVVLIVAPGPFALGQAIANGFIDSGLTFDGDVRRIQIVL